MSVRGRRSERLPECSVFHWLEEASAFFQAGSLGYSATPDPSRFQGLDLHCLNWHVEPLEVEEVRSSFFEDESLFPKGSIEFDCALLMHGIEHEWHGKSDPKAAIAAWESCLKVNPSDPKRAQIEQMIAQAKRHLDIAPGTKTDKPAM